MPCRTWLHCTEESEILREDSESFGISAGFQDSWLDSKMPVMIPKIPAYHIRQKYNVNVSIRKSAGRFI